ncbi:uncharacterized protein LOC128882902 [Hylaeus volcanicus]|uniref:uncharacterized protein LOC128882902 n=1 Tax=Hylaeus volcanicus TaxID=313075 RepID=UPI0023B7DEF0|nr:uncharacterized protein LOC128882902 [Hylaeus volcanicus]XP_053990718.1 uncharacterized protein LOC128882902 [Hylaeus volcanicus]XP_053990719.1 uncharacterized protein LOC128882902 [Hylaeus volcanicus]XP_053990720.1 uncharacterized protein LOC128882902 [Hylaeus volcanicus]XP_053990721.1 uncharacterized protein LOC128882902 [Hylaeus volcanicus]
MEMISRLEEKCVNTVRCISAACPQIANSGHPGAPIGCAAIAHTLWTKIMNYAPHKTDWIARDRFVLSNGHACALQYTMLHLVGYDLSLDDLKQFRQIGSKTPGHPECFKTPGIEVTTGPLGQGIAQAVGLAIATEMMAAKYNRPNLVLFDNYVYTLVGDGCLQEGVASEACSLAGHLGLGRLIVLYDKNKISIDGDTDLSFSENVQARFQSYGWNVLCVANATCEVDAIWKAVQSAQECRTKPTLIICETIIGYGTRFEATEKVHGAPLGTEELLKLRAKFGLSSSEDLFHIDADVLSFYKKAGEDASKKYTMWLKLVSNYAQHYPNEYQQLQKDFSGRFDSIDWIKDFPVYSEASSPQSTRALSGQILNCLVSKISNIVGGSADLTVSNCTVLKNVNDFTKLCRNGRYIRYGVREHGMAAISNGIFAYGGLRPFAATFLNFITYAWGSVRLSALSGFGILYVATHDSIGLGEDGPTHQPVEVASLCRSTPNLHYFRPADGREVIAGYRSWLDHSKTPTILALSRGNLPHLKGSSVDKALKGGYVLSVFANTGLPQLILASCGSEVSLCVEAAKELDQVVDISVVSIPCWELFMKQQTDYQKEVLFKKNVIKIWVESATACRYDHLFDETLHMTTFGESGSDKQLKQHFGFTLEALKALVFKTLKQNRS